MIATEKKLITEDVPLEFQYHGRNFKGTAEPITSSCSEGVCFELNVTLNDKNLGRISCGFDGNWKIKGIIDQEFVDAIGQEIFLWYE